MTFFQHKCEYRQILLNGPLSSFYVVVKVIEPMLPALLRSLEVLSVRLEEKNLGNLRPSTIQLASK